VATARSIARREPCIAAKDTIEDVYKCLADYKDVQSVEHGQPAGPNEDISCTAVGVHVNEVIMAEATLMAPGVEFPNTEVSDDPKLPFAQRVERWCTSAPWSEKLRRCYVGAMKIAELNACAHI
jgi:hypothetical protein